MDDANILEHIAMIQSEQDPVRKAQRLKRLRDDYDVTYSHIAQKLSVSPTYISNYLRLLRLPDLILDGYYAGNISLTHLCILARVKDQVQVVNLYEQVLARNMSALDLEEAVRNILYATVSEGESLAPSVKAALEKKIKKYEEDAMVKIIQTRIKAKLIIELKGNRTKTSDFLTRIAEE